MLNKKLIIFFFVLIILVIPVSAACTASIDKNDYEPLETATATFTISIGSERSKAYNASWHNGSEVLEIDTGITPSSTSTLFFESHTFSSSAVANNGNVTLTIEGGTTCESSFFNISGLTSTRLRILDVSFAGNLLVGRTAGINFHILDSNDQRVNNARCGLDLLDEQGFHLTRAIREVITYDTHGTFGNSISFDAFNEGADFAIFVHCNCGLNNTDRTCWNRLGNTLPLSSGSTEAIFHIGKWLDSVNTITDKRNYNLNTDEQVLVCVNITNNQSERLPLFIEYDMRCDGGEDNSTGRILMDQFMETRGINANTTQNQCGALELKNIPVVQNKLSTCQASTTVEVRDKELNRILVTYTTLSPLFNITSDSNVSPGEGGINMIALTMGFAIIILFYFGMGYFTQFERIRSGLFAIKFFGYGMGLIQVILFVFILYAADSGISLNHLLFVNFWMVLISGMGLGFAGLYLNAMSFVRIDKIGSEGKWEEKKWKE